MSSTSATSSAGLNIEDLRELVKKDLDASNELQNRIDRIRKYAAAGEKPDSTEVSLVGVEHKQIGRDLVSRIEQIEQQKDLMAADRNMLQVLTARLGVHDLQSARIAELGDLLAPQEWLRAEELPKGVKPSHKARTGSYGTQSGTSALNQAAESGQTSPAAQSPESATASCQDRDVEAESPTSLPVMATGINYVEDEDDLSDEYEIVHEDEEEPEVDKLSWPLLYRILDIDPDTPGHLFSDRLNNCYRALALKHDPDRFPNDPSAPDRWAACNKAYAILVDPERKRFYDLHGKTPKDLQDFDLSKLSISD